MRLTKLLTPAISSFLVVVSMALVAQLQPAPYIQEPLSAHTIELPTPSPTAAQAKPATKAVTPTKKPTPRQPKPTCIITVNGKRYDVQALRRTHSGGNIFVCGSNMTKLFNQQHGTDYGLIAKYRI